MGRLPRHRLDRGDAFIFRLMGQHRAGDDVANGVDAGNAGLKPGIDFHPASFIEIDPHLIQPQTLRVGHPADGHQNHVAFDLFTIAAFRRSNAQAHPASGDLGRRDLGGQAKVHALVGEDSLHLLGGFPIHGRQDRIKELHHRDLGAEPPPDRAHLEADITAAHHHHVLGHLGEGERPGRGNDTFFIDFDARQWRHIGTGGDQDVLGFMRRRRTLLRRDRDLTGGGNGPPALDPGHLVLLEQVVDSRGQVADHLILVGEHGGDIEVDAVGFNAMGPETRFGLLIKGRGMQKCLGRDAADVETGAAERPAHLHAGGLKAQLGGTDGGDIAARTGADDDEIETLIRIRHVKRPARYAGVPRCIP